MGLLWINIINHDSFRSLSLTSIWSIYGKFSFISILEVFNAFPAVFNSALMLSNSTIMGDISTWKGFSFYIWQYDMYLSPLFYFHLIDQGPTLIFLGYWILNSFEGWLWLFLCLLPQLSFQVWPEGLGRDCESQLQKWLQGCASYQAKHRGPACHVFFLSRPLN